MYRYRVYFTPAQGIHTSVNSMKTMDLNAKDEYAAADQVTKIFCGAFIEKVVMIGVTDYEVDVVSILNRIAEDVSGFDRKLMSIIWRLDDIEKRLGNDEEV